MMALRALPLLDFRYNASALQDLLNWLDYFYISAGGLTRF